MSSSSRFANLTEAPIIEPFLLTAQFKADPASVKVNAGQGSYREELLTTSNKWPSTNM